MGSTPVEGSENSFSEYFDLRTLLHYLPYTYFNSFSTHAFVGKFLGHLDYTSCRVTARYEELLWPDKTHTT